MQTRVSWPDPLSIKGHWQAIVFVLAIACTINVSVGTAIKVNTILEVDDNLDGRIDFLEVIVTSEGLLSGDYRFHIGLFAADQPVTAASTAQRIEDDTDTVTLRLEGKEVFKSKLAGPYEVRVAVTNLSDASLVDSIEGVTTKPYDWSDFEVPVIHPTRFEEAVVEEDGFSGLRIRTWLEVAVPGWYALYATIGDSERLLGDAEIQTYLEGGSNTVNFEWTSHYFRSLSTPTNLILRYMTVTTPDDGMLESYEDPYVTTWAYTSSDFSPGPVEISGPLREERVDLDGDGLLERLDLLFRVNASVGGSYFFCGELTDGKNISIQLTRSERLDEGISEVALSMDNEVVWSNQITGNLRMSYIKCLDQLSRPLTELIDAYTTSAINYMDFSPPPLFDVQVVSDSGRDQDGDGYFEGISIALDMRTNLAGTCYLSVVLVDEAGLEVDTYSEVRDMTKGEFRVEAYLEGSKIHQRRVNGTLRVSEVSVWCTPHDKTWIIHPNYVTSLYSWDCFESAGYGCDVFVSGADEIGKKVVEPGKRTVSFFVIGNGGPNPALDIQVSVLDRMNETLTVLLETKISSLRPGEMKNLSLEWNPRAGTHEIAIKANSSVEDWNVTNNIVRVWVVSMIGSPKKMMLVVVQDNRGRPIKGARVEMERSGSTYINGTTALDGSFSSPLELGNYTLVVSKSGYLESRRQIDTSKQSEAFTIHSVLHNITGPPMPPAEGVKIPPLFIVVMTILVMIVLALALKLRK